MKRLFGREKPKIVKSASVTSELSASPEDSHYPPENHYVPHPPHIQDRAHAITRTSSDDHWDLVSSQDGSSPILSPFVPRAVSPFGGANSVHSNASNTHRDRDRDPQTLRKKPQSAPNPSAAIGILRSLDPHPPPTPETQIHFRESQYEDQLSITPLVKEDKKERKGFWERASGKVEKEREKHRHRDKEREVAKDRETKDDDGQAELTRMIGYLTATASEDWSLVLEVCERASSSESAARETVKALRREFKYAEPPAQLSAARLWAILLRNASSTFMSQCTSRKFLETLEDVIQSPRTSPVVKERLLQVLAAAASASTSSGKHGRHDKDGFRSLWKKLKSPDQPDEGIPFDEEDAMLNPPVPPVPSFHYTEPSPLTPSHKPPPPARHKSTKGIIPPEEDIRRLFQECKVGRGNAALLSEALAFAKPQDLEKKAIIQEFYARCRASQELIYAQIPWASANAERSRNTVPRENQGGRKRKGSPRVANATIPQTPVDETIEEQLLAALLSANEELTEALRVYDDLERVKLERDVQKRSEKEIRMDRRHRSQQDESDSSVTHGHSSSRATYSTNGPPSSPSLSPSPSPAPSVMVTPIIPNHSHPLPPIPGHTHSAASLDKAVTGSQTLAPPPHAPLGPRGPAPSNISRSRSPSPEARLTTPPPHQVDTPEWDERLARQGLLYSSGAGKSTGHRIGNGHAPEALEDGDSSEDLGDDEVSERRGPTAKALGKRRMAEGDEPGNPFDPDEMFYEHPNESRQSDVLDSDSDDTSRRPQVHYIYDAAAELTRKRIEEGRLAAATLVGGVQ